MVRQFAKIDIQLEVRATDNNQFQDKVRKGKHQIFWLGWNADYPDAENFLFLLYGPRPQDQVRRREHRQLRRTPSTTACSSSMKTLDDGPEKQQLIDKMVAHRAAGRALDVGLLPLRVGRGRSNGCTTSSRRS